MARRAERAPRVLWNTGGGDVRSIRLVVHLTLIPMILVALAVADSAPGTGQAGEIDPKVKNGSTCSLATGTGLSLSRKNAVEARNADVSGDGANSRAMIAGGNMVQLKAPVEARVIDLAFILVKAPSAKANKGNGWGLTGPWEVLDWAGLDSLLSWTMTGAKHGWSAVPAAVLQIRVLTDGALLGREAWITGRYCYPR